MTGLTELEIARIEAEGLTGAFEDHRARMDPTSTLDRLTEKALHAEATRAQRRLQQLESFEAHVADALEVVDGTPYVPRHAYGTPDDAA